MKDSSGSHGSEGSNEAIKNPIDGLIQALHEHVSRGSDSSALELALRSKKQINNLGAALLRSQRELEELNAALGTGLDDTSMSILIGENGSLGFFPKAHHMVVDALSEIVDAYLKIGAEFNVYIKNKIDDDKMTITAIAAQKATEMLERSLEMMIESKTRLPKVVRILRDAFGKYNGYLRKKFVKSEETDDKNVTPLDVMRMLNEGNTEWETEYVKIKMVANNPVLTDALLQVIGGLPEYRERLVGKEGKRKSQVKELSEFAVENAAEKLAAVSDPLLLHYLQNPNNFFEMIGGMLENFVRVAQRLEPHQRAILDMPHYRLFVSDPVALRKILQEDKTATQREVGKIKRMDLDMIVQREDDYTPDNKREIDYFKLRDELLGMLQNRMNALSEIRDIYDREEKAKKIVREAVKLKSEMVEVAISQKARRLREDKHTDNEYYVGRQGQHGRFHFERKPTPNASLDGVIGKSFNTAKAHLQEIIDGAVCPRVMSLSAPGGKVRSNILLIGPYGCGKTELARAICADPRVIGASVSVANTLTAFMHESVNNVKRIYDEAVELRSNARDAKPVVLVLDEFDGWFVHSEFGTFTEVDMAQIENVFLEVLDGMEDYNGVVTMGMTNNPRGVPKGILRRFRYVDIVGQLTHDERTAMLRMYLEKSLPVHDSVRDHYGNWAKRLEDAPGDVVRKVVDEVHFAMIPKFLSDHPTETARIERVLYKRENRRGVLRDDDVHYVKTRLAKYGTVVTPERVDAALDGLLTQPPIRMQIDAARKVYQDAEELLKDLSTAGPSFGLRKRSGLFDLDR